MIQTTHSNERQQDSVYVDKYQVRTKLRLSFQEDISQIFSEVCTHSLFELLTENLLQTKTCARWKLFGFCSLSWVIKTVWKGALCKTLYLQAKHSVFILSSGKENMLLYCAWCPMCFRFKQKKTPSEWENIRKVILKADAEHEQAYIVNKLQKPVKLQHWWSVQLKINS